MIPLIKVVSLLFRVFSKPLINYTKVYHATNGINSRRFKTFFVMMGNKYHRFQNFINKRYLKVANQFAYKPLNDSLAVQKGIEFFYEIIFYTIILGFPIYELYLASEESKEKSARVNGRIKGIEEKSKQLREKIQKLIQLKKANETLESSMLNYNLKNLTQLKLSPVYGFNFSQSPIRLQYGNKLIKEFKYCVAS